MDDNPNAIRDKKKYDSLLPMRIKVRLDYGVGVFGADSIINEESPAQFTDAQLAKRWKGMIDSAGQVGHCIDLQGMLPNAEDYNNEISDFDGEANEGGSAMDTDNDCKSSNNSTTNDTATKSNGSFFASWSYVDSNQERQRKLFTQHGNW